MKVVCVDASEISPRDGLVVGQVYTVVGLSGCQLKLAESIYTWNPRRFKEVQTMQFSDDGKFWCTGTYAGEKNGKHLCRHKTGYVSTWKMVRPQL